MAKKPTVTTLQSGFNSTEVLNQNFEALRDAFDNTLSLDGSIPNALSGDLDLNGNSIANAGGILVGGEDVLGLVTDSAASATASAAEASVSASQAAISEASAEADAASAATSWGYFSPYTDEITVIGADLTDGSFQAGSIYDFGSITTPTSGPTGSPDGFIVSVYNNLDDVETVAGLGTEITSVSGIASDVTTVAGIATAVSSLGSISADVTAVADISSDVTSVVANETAISALGPISSDIQQVSAISANVVTAAGIATDITAVAADATDIGVVAGSIADVNTVAGISANVSAVATDAADIGTVAGLSTEITALGPVASDISTVSGLTAEVTSVAGNEANIEAVGTISDAISTVAAIDSDVTTVAGVSSDVTALAGNAADIGAVAADIADVNTVAGMSSTINVLAGDEADLLLVAADIANVNTVATNMADVNSFGETYRIGATDPTESLDVGDLFFNNTTGVLKVYDGAGWTAGVTAGSGFLALTGGTLTGDLVLNADPTLAKGAATKEYVDTIAAAGLHYHDPVRVESPVNLPATYDNGTAGVGATLTNSGTQAAIEVDGVTLAVDDRVLLYHQTNEAHNGIYKVTDTGSASTNWVLTRTTDADTYAPSDPDNFGQGDAFYVQEGMTGAGELYVMNTAGAITFGTTAIHFAQVSSAAVYSAGTGVSFNGTEINIGQAVGTTDSPTFANISANNITVTGNVDGRNVSADGTKLDGIEAAATADQTPAELLTALKTVDGVSSGLDADLLDGQEGSYYLDGNNFINMPAGYADSDVDTHLNIVTASASEFLSWNGSDYDWATPTDTTYSAGSGLDLTGTTFSVENDLRGEVFYIGRDTSDYFGVETTQMNFVLDGNTDMRLYNNGDLHVDGNVIAYSSTISDERLKTDIVQIDGALDKLNQLNGYTFTYTADGKKSAGVIAQEVEKVLPSAITESKLPLKTGDDQTEYKTVQYDQLVGLLIESVKELTEKVALLESKVTE